MKEIFSRFMDVSYKASDQDFEDVVDLYLSDLNFNLAKIGSMIKRTSLLNQKVQDWITDLRSGFFLLPFGESQLRRRKPSSPSPEQLSDE